MRIGGILRDIGEILFGSSDSDEASKGQTAGQGREVAEIDRLAEESFGGLLFSQAQLSQSVINQTISQNREQQTQQDSLREEERKLQERIDEKRKEDKILEQEADDRFFRTVAENRAAADQFYEMNLQRRKAQRS